MGLLAPGALGFGAGLIALLLLLYLLRPRRAARTVSSTLLWLAALNDAQAQQPWRRIPPRLLLLVQVLTLAALAAALARPYVVQTNAPGPFSIVVLDASASMQATDVTPSRFAAAQQRVRTFVNGLDRGDAAALIVLDGAPRVASPASDDRAALLGALDALHPSSSSPRLAAALALAESLASGHPDAQVTIVGDGSPDREHDVPAGYPLPLRWLGVGSPDANNLAVTGLTTREANGHLSALARVVNTSARQVAASVTLRVDGARFDTQPLALAPLSTAEAMWDNLPPSAQTLEARLGGPDALALDDAAFTVLPTDRPTRTVLITDGNAFLERALALRAHATVTVVRPGDAAPIDTGVDLVVCDGVAPPALPSGTALWLVHPPLGTSLLSVGQDVDISSVAAAEPSNSLAGDLALAAVHVNRARRLETPGWAEVVVTAPETPLLLLGSSGGRRVAVLGFDVHQSDLPLQPAFPVLVQRVFDGLVPRTTAATPVVNVGDPVALAPLPSTTILDILDPAGRATPLTLSRTSPTTFTATDAPGLYTVVERDAEGLETRRAFAVNFVDERQSRLLPGVDASPALTARPAQPVQAPREFWPVLAVLALAGLGLELALDWWHFLARTARAHLVLALRATAAMAVAAALLGVSLPRVAARQATVFVVDASGSMAASQSDIEVYLRQAIAQRAADDVYAVVATGRAPIVTQPVGQAPLDLSRLTEVNADGTDLAAGLRLAADILPAGYRPRIVLLSDGQETRDSAASTARLLAARGIEVDTVPLGGSAGPEVLVERVTVPSHVRQGERFTIGVRLATNVVTDVTVHVLVNGQPLVDTPVSLSAAHTDLSYASVADRSGLVAVTASIDPRLDTLSANNAAFAVVAVDGPPRVLVVEGRPNEGAAMVNALHSTGVPVDTAAYDALPASVDALGAYSAVVLADVSASALSGTQLSALRSFVRDLGHGLVAIGGDTSFGQGEYVDTPLDDVLPVRSSVRAHRDAGRTAMVLVIDKSGSMDDDVGGEGTTKLQMARAATVLAAQQLGVRDAVGLLAFDSQPHWLLPLTPVLGLGPAALDDQLANVVADGGTDIYPALATAIDATAATDARYKHVILLTDGQSCCGGNYPGLLDRMRQAHITLSTIGIGADADGQLLSSLARQGDGRYYFTDHARDIPRLMTRETELATRGPLVENLVTPRQVAFDRALSDISGDGFPSLTGYLVTTAKDSAQVLLATESGDPILARWQVGLGRSVAWTSDLRGRWSDTWLSWSATPRFLSDLVSWTLPGPSGPLRLSVREDTDSAHITVDDTDSDASPLRVTARLAQPDGAGADAELAPTAPGRYEGTVALAGPGVYTVRADAQRDGVAVGSAEAGLPVSYSPELRSVGTDDARLDAIASAAHGHRLSAPAAAFADDLAPVTTSLPFVDALLVVAALVLLLDVAIRRLRLAPRDLWEWCRRPRSAHLDLDLPWRVPASGLPAAPWSPGVWLAERRARAPVVRAVTTPTLGGPATPGLARHASPDPAQPEPTSTGEAAEEQDALAETLRWLAARRGHSSGDRG